MNGACEKQGKTSYYKGGDLEKLSVKKMTKYVFCSLKFGKE